MYNVLFIKRISSDGGEAYEPETLETEQRNPNTRSIDSMTTAGYWRPSTARDAGIATGCKPVSAQLTQLVDRNLRAPGTRRTPPSISGPGLPAAWACWTLLECPPTWRFPGLVQGNHAGGDRAFESSGGRGQRTGRNRRPAGAGHFPKDAVVGLAASGRTLLIGALDYADSVGAYTGAVSCVRR